MKALPPISLELADELQNFTEIARFLDSSPVEAPRVEGIDISGLSLPLRSVVGGDHTLYIDFSKRYGIEARIEEAQRAGRDDLLEALRRTRERAGVLLADVSGHRMTDAAIAAMLHQSFLLGASYELDMFGEITTRIFERINSRFYDTNCFHKYFTLIYGEISSRGKFRFVSAGHQPPGIFSRKYGRFLPISREQIASFPPVGMLPSGGEMGNRSESRPRGYKTRYEVNEINLMAAGDILVLHTDGLSEHGDGSYFPEEFERVLAGHYDDSAVDLCGRLRESLLEWATPRDDISLVVIKFAPG